MLGPIPRLILGRLTEGRGKLVAKARWLDNSGLKGM